jgi:hypothetical protein
MSMRVGWSLLALALLGFAPAARAAGWQAGAARAAITPEGPIWMAGYGSRTRPSEGALHDLWAKALALRDPSGRVGVLVTLDVCGIDRELSNRIRDAIGKAHGLDRAAIVLACSHTHCGPVLGTNLIGMYPLDETQLATVAQYAERFERTVVDVVGKAIGALAPATLAWGQGRCEFAVNRRNNDQAKAAELRDALALEGPVDHDVPVLAVRDGAGALKAVVAQYACHCTVLPINRLNGDYAGFAQIALEARHPGAQAMFVAGCGADQNPLPRGTIAHAERYGNRLADAVDEVLAGALRPVVGAWSQSYEEIPLAFGAIPDRAAWAKEAQSPTLAVRNRAKAMLATLEKGESLPTTYPYPVQLWRLGPDLDWIFLGGEVTVGYALRLKRNLGSSRTFVAAYCNDVMAYIPTKVVLDEGGYEGGGAMVYYGQPAPWSGRVEEQIVGAVRRLVAASGPHPARAGAPGR